MSYTVRSDVDSPPSVPEVLRSPQKRKKGEEEEEKRTIRWEKGEGGRNESRAENITLRDARGVRPSPLPAHIQSRDSPRGPKRRKAAELLARIFRRSNHATMRESIGRDLIRE